MFINSFPKFNGNVLEILYVKYLSHYTHILNSCCIKNATNVLRKLFHFVNDRKRAMPRWKNMLTDVNCIKCIDKIYKKKYYIFLSQQIADK